ncbi:MAG: hypothetical protein MR004_09075 [Clostridiales bacterium]|nr:hypothetical protein [Clostridiales bacterium]MDY4035890.1 hypothetical protein [Candidatus Pseudoscilispira sp.]
MLLWIVLGAVALVLCLLLSMKIGVRLVYDAAQLRVWLQLGPVMLQVYPEKDAKSNADKKRKNVKKNAPDKGTEKASKLNMTAEAVFSLLKELLPPLLDVLGRVRRGIRVRCLSLHLVISDPNPAEAARRYGMVNTVLWPLLAVIENTVSVERRTVRIELDFAAQQSRVEGELFLTMRLLHGAAIVLADGLRCLKPLLRFWKKTKPEKNQQQKQEKTASVQKLDAA